MTNLRFSHFLFLFLLPCFTYFFHEYAHWLAYHSYEIDAQLYVNTIRLPKEIRLTAMQKVIIYGSGVIFTLLQGVIGFWVALKKRFTYRILYIAFRCGVSMGSYDARNFFY